MAPWSTRARARQGRIEYEYHFIEYEIKPKSRNFKRHVSVQRYDHECANHESSEDGRARSHLEPNARLPWGTTGLDCYRVAVDGEVGGAWERRTFKAPMR
jgi:hypothetical protein